MTTKIWQNTVDSYDANFIMKIQSFTDNMPYIRRYITNFTLIASVVSLLR